MKLRFSKAALAAVVLLTSVAAPAFAQKDKSKALTIKGSDTMVNLSAAWAQAFMKTAPDKVVVVNGGGSGVGIAAILAGTTDICNSSRDVRPEEKKKGADAGVNLVETNVAMDGIAIIVNPANPLTEITMNQLKQIYTGEVTNWKDINGQDVETLVYSRETSSGTYVFFQEHVLKLEDYTASARLMPATSAIVEAVASDKSAIGYVGLGYAAASKDRVKVLPVKADASSPAVEATDESVHSGKYSIARFLHCYTNGKPKGDAKAFLDFCISPAGQEIVRAQGYVTLN
jgi:phosphate transport system substrate-binding protein